MKPYYVCPSCGEGIDNIDTYQTDYLLQIALCRLVLRQQGKGDYGTVDLSLVDLVSVPQTDELWVSNPPGRLVVELRKRQPVDAVEAGDLAKLPADPEAARQQLENAWPPKDASE